VTLNQIILVKEQIILQAERNLLQFLSGPLDTDWGSFLNGRRLSMFQQPQLVELLLKHMLSLPGTDAKATNCYCNSQA
jgi:hypothetical protein